LVEKTTKEKDRFDLSKGGMIWRGNGKSTKMGLKEGGKEWAGWAQLRLK